MKTREMELSGVDEGQYEGSTLQSAMRSRGGSNPLTHSSELTPDTKFILLWQLSMPQLREFAVLETPYSAAAASPSPGQVQKLSLQLQMEKFGVGGCPDEVGTSRFDGFPQGRRSISVIERVNSLDKGFIPCCRILPPDFLAFCALSGWEHELSCGFYTFCIRLQMLW